MFKLSAAARAIGAQLRGDDVQINRVTTDSRDICGGDLFVAIKGPRFDGHDFVEQAVADGAAAMMVTACSATNKFLAPALVVDDVRLAYGRLAAWWRALFSIPLVAITGSNGKTTVKDMLASILRLHCGEGSVLVTRGNLNNDIGMPAMLLELEPHHRFAVIEMGMNHLGEIAYLSRLARPTVALINNAGTAHIGEVGSVEAIARAKGEIFSGLDYSGVAVINGDDASANYWRSLVVDRRVVNFGLSAKANVSARYELSETGSLITLRTEDAEFPVTLQVPGLHNVKNALAATAAAFVLDVSSEQIATGLSTFEGVPGRLQRKVLPGGDVILDDTYNANLESMQVALSVLGTSTHQKFLVMGDMGELGDAAGTMHADIGLYARRSGVNRLFAFGELCRETVRTFGAGATHYPNLEEMLSDLRSALDGSTTVLVKGSRFMRMERVVVALQGDVVSVTGGIS